jgi:excisionase family DNA binding protein
LRAPDGAAVELPPVAVLVLYDVLERLDAGTDVLRTRRGGRAAGRDDPLLTTQQAADLLSVSRPFLIKLLDEGAIPFVRTGAHRRIRRSAVLAYRARRDAQERRAVDELTRQAVEMGLYDVDVAPEDLLDSIARIREERLERG